MEAANYRNLWRLLLGSAAVGVSGLGSGVRLLRVLLISSCLGRLTLCRRVVKRCHCAGSHRARCILAKCLRTIGGVALGLMKANPLALRRRLVLHSCLPDNEVVH